MLAQIKLFGDTVIKIPFNYNEESTIFSSALIEVIVKLHTNQMSSYVSEENVHKFHHGKGWGRVSDKGEDESLLKPVSVSLTIEKESIIKNDISKMFDFMSEFSEGFTSQLVGNMFSTVIEACDKTGNIVKQSDGKSQADMMLELLKKVELTVDENGQVSLPSLYMAPGKAEPLIKELESQPPEFHEEFELIKKQKTEIAFEGEKLRLSKFKAINFE